VLAVCGTRRFWAPTTLFPADPSSNSIPNHTPKAHDDYFFCIWIWINHSPIIIKDYTNLPDPSINRVRWAAL
jgi:hypothetical protein